jgi:hypothetical protein
MIFEGIFRCKGLGDGEKTLGAIAHNLEEAAKHLLEMEQAGLLLTGDVTDDYAVYYTEDKLLALKYGMTLLEAAPVEPPTPAPVEEPPPSTEPSS